MDNVNVFWDPTGFELDVLGNKRFLSTSDGDTPAVSMTIRLLSVDTPEIHYPGRARPSKMDEPLEELADWMQQGHAPIRSDLANHLRPKLATGEAGTLQETQGEKAKEVFEELLTDKLTRANSNRKRQVFLRTADQPFDKYGRLLAYMAPNYTPEERNRMSPSERATFNLLLIDSGWGASFIIFPSLPKQSDLILLRNAAKDALLGRKGAWADDNSLTGYEFRMCVRLHKITKKLVSGKKLSSSERYAWISRYCFDLTNREIFYPQDYHWIKPYNRIFIWAEDVNDAVSRINLIPHS